MAKIIAIDFGLKRCGIAATDDLQIIASGLTTVETKDIFTFLTNYFNTNSVSVIVLGEPKRMDGSDTHNSQPVRDFKKKLETLYADKKIKLIDERFTSKMAVQSMIESGQSKKKRQNKNLIDEISATIILQSYLQAR